MSKVAPHLYSREAEEQFRQQALRNNQHFHQQHLIGGSPRPVFGEEKSVLVQQIQALEDGYGEQEGGENYVNLHYDKAQAVDQEPNGQIERQQNNYWTQEPYERMKRMPSHIYQRVQSPSPPRHLYRQGQQAQPQQYEQFIQYQEAYPPYIRQQQYPGKQQQHQQEQQIRPNTWVGAVDYAYDENFPFGPTPVFTTKLPQQAPSSLHYKSMAEKKKAVNETAYPHHSPVEGASERGYLFGGMDFIDHASPNHLSYFDPKDYELYEGEHRSRRDEAVGPPRRPNDFYGLDYNTLASPQQHTPEDDLNYKGYVAQQPRKHCLYTADLNAPINNFETAVVESVNPVKLIGDTLSNQKIDVAHELTEEEKNTFGTTYAPPAGFKPEHRTVHPEPKSPGPICFSLSAKKELICGRNSPRTSTPSSRSQNAMVMRHGGPLSAENSSWYTTGNKEIMRNEPNWSRNVNQRRNAWEMQSRSVDARMQLPSWAKVPPQQPPYWASRAHTTHNVWQSATDKGYVASGNYNTGYNCSNDASNPAQWQQQPQGRQQAQVQRAGSAQPTQNKQSNSQPNRQSQHNQVESQTYIKYQYPVVHPITEQHLHKQVYYHEHPKEQHMVDYEGMHTQEQYSQQPEHQKYNPEEGKFSDQIQIFHHPQQPAPQRAPLQTCQRTEKQYYQKQQPQYVDKHHQKVMQEALKQASPQQHPHSNSSTTNLINQSQRSGAEGRPERSQKQSSTANTTSYYAQQPPAHYESAVEKPNPGSNHKVLPSTRSQSHNIGSSQRVGGQVSALLHVGQQQGGGNQSPTRSLHQQQQRQQINMESIASRYPPSRQQNHHLSIQYDPKREMAEKLPEGQLSQSYMNTCGQFQDRDGCHVNYSRELSTSTNPGQEMQLLKQQERRVVDEPVPQQPGIISRNVTTKFYKKKVTNKLATHQQPTV